ncbi:efflux RND transporter periplasmic adaptor subunit [Flaviflagellibacter deserti]|uniref:Efflux RND transporter periplasmic adaptor subunit n=1 Tax=Flaviflagellibacter deserti TaxID=2267266 RepID=A0ABV9Z2C9_9HYPH
MARMRSIAAGGILIAAVSGGSIFGWYSSQTSASATIAAAPPPSVVVSVPLKREITDWNEFAGRFEPSASVDIRARVTGYLRSIDFQDGQIVEAGQLLFVVDQRPYQTALAQARAQRSSAQAAVELASLELRRSEQLVGSNAVSQASLDQRRQQKKDADASLELAEAAVARAQLDLDYTEIRAPIAGRVSNRRVDPGTLITDSVLLTTIVALDPIYFVFDVSERDLLSYQRGLKKGEIAPLRDKSMPVEARMQGDEDWPYRGSIDFVDNRLEAGSGTIRARATLPNPDLFITPGQFGRLRMPLTRPYEALLIPETATLRDQADRVVLTVDADNKLKATKVELGSSQGRGLRVVRGGIGPQDRIVINGLMRARAGQAVSPQAGEIEPSSTALAN